MKMRAGVCASKKARDIARNNFDDSDRRPLFPQCLVYVVKQITVFRYTRISGGRSLEERVAGEGKKAGNRKGTYKRARIETKKIKKR